MRECDVCGCRLVGPFVTADGKGKTWYCPNGHPPQTYRPVPGTSK